MDITKTVKKYGKIYRKILDMGKYTDPDAKQNDYEKRLAEMYASEKYKEHSVYPSTNTDHIYGVIAMCLELKGFGLSDQEIIDVLNLTGRKLNYVLGIPKGDGHDWTNRKVAFFGKEFQTIGEPTEGLEGLTPLEWNRKVRCERIQNG